MLGNIPGRVNRLTGLQASSGPEALRLLEGRSIDLLVTDVVMPSMDGRELADRIRERRPSIAETVCAAHARARKMREVIRQSDVAA